MLLNDNLEKTAKQLYDYWFVQFDFPDKDGKTYKSSGGAMVWNDDLHIDVPINWNTCLLSNYIGIPDRTLFDNPICLNTTLFPQHIPYFFVKVGIDALRTIEYVVLTFSLYFCLRRGYTPFVGQDFIIIERQELVYACGELLHRERVLTLNLIF